MSLVPSREIYREAIKHNYAVGGFPAYSIETVQGVIEAAKKTNIPILLMIGNIWFREINNLEPFVDYIKNSVNKIDIPMALHLDHGNIQTFEEIKKCVDLGFTSVMFDASRLSLKENIKETKRVVDYCHQFNVTVEGAVGHMPLGDCGEVTVTKQKENIGVDEQDFFTSAKDTEIFSRETNVDVVSVSVGTIHGLVQNKKAKINVELLREIRGKTNAYLTVHGGTDTPLEEIKKLIENGVVKINVVSAVMRALFRHMKEIINASKNELIINYNNRFVVEKEVTSYIKSFTKFMSV